MIKWGIIGAGNIAQRFASALAHQKDSTLEAVACRTLEKAQAFSNKYPCNIAYGSFQEIIDNKDIDAVYIAVPHLNHYEWIVKALKARKAVLVEKPAVLDKGQMEYIKELSNKYNTFFMEAMKSKCVPAFEYAKEIIEDGKIGDIQKVTTSFCNISPYVEGKYHYQPKQGGALYDIGVYNTAYLTTFLDGDYSIKDLKYRLYTDDIDIYCNVEFAYENGQIGILETAFDTSTENFALISGTKGSIKISPLHRPTTIVLDDGTTVVKDYEIDDFYSQIEEVCRCILKGKIESNKITHNDSILMVDMLQRCKDYINKNND